MKALIQLSLVLTLVFAAVPAALACGGRAQSAVTASNDAIAPAVEAPATPTEAEATETDAEVCPQAAGSCDCPYWQGATTAETDNSPVLINTAGDEASSTSCPHAVETQQAEQATTEEPTS